MPNVRLLLDRSFLFSFILVVGVMLAFTQGWKSFQAPLTVKRDDSPRIAFLSLRTLRLLCVFSWSHMSNLTTTSLVGFLFLTCNFIRFTGRIPWFVALLFKLVLMDGGVLDSVSNANADLLQTLE
ncbi:hypothetical protein K432DRAFT_111064 [Lepidopterella palustris CBS 459.81]|uniref:Uncharacterized protein n=1 Tax=Lepidopterella palustris CBS 459.81 TaxID=1314670 RepID=A0A8E2EM12_9PEZI|nr:hypothetical protein K432DRAFT_111064 [Lepidopterella palustris CBS 459.81]